MRDLKSRDRSRSFCKRKNWKQTWTDSAKLRISRIVNLPCSGTEQLRQIKRELLLLSYAIPRKQTCLGSSNPRLI